MAVMIDLPATAMPFAAIADIDLLEALAGGELGRAPEAPRSLRKDLPLLSELLARQGFATALWSGNPYLYGRFKDGFQTAEVGRADGDAQIDAILADLKPRGSWRFSSKEELVADMSRKIRVLPGVPTNFSQVIQDNVEESLSGRYGKLLASIFNTAISVFGSRPTTLAVNSRLSESATFTDVSVTIP